jgi:hypothetical protein
MYLYFLRRMRNISLKSLIPDSDSNVAVVCPAASKNGNLSKEACMTAEEAMALAEVLQCIGTINKKPGVYSCTETMRQSGVISLGGLHQAHTGELDCVHYLLVGIHYQMRERSVAHLRPVRD